MIVWRVGILTVSDKGAQGKRKDVSGEEIRRLVPLIKGTVAVYEIVPDEQEVIENALIRMADEERLDLVLTTGGTGLSLRDVTPEATKRVMDREVPGIPEAMRMTTLEKTKFAMLSRSVAGTRGQTLMINLPGSPKAVRECLEAVLEVLPHALKILHGTIKDHGKIRK
ncbi:MogA/MoaB family molybdenum cofactor biosynthesis protein [Melghirimyces algeriensis]|uniref:MogA/MoaB family molybdenum cofactor biosynthesis protein n=1 Tax=Melghirimyces algeriensis TaxID=910412 RepID=UPI001157A3C6